MSNATDNTLQLQEHEHHHHDHECCEHDHEHHHHNHECCEHEHEHHHHDHECCEHEHEHEHHHGYELEITTHDSSIIATYKFSVHQSMEKAIELTDSFFIELGNAIRKNKGFIGHIKATILKASEGYKISLTKDTLDKTEFSYDTLVVEGVAIVFNLSEDALEEIVEHEIENIIKD